MTPDAEVKFITPRAKVRRAQARVVVRDLERKRLKVTERSVEVYAMARFAGDLSHTQIREVVDCALAIVRGEEMPAVAEPVSVPAAAEEEDPEPSLSREEMRAIICEELRKNPEALAPDILEVVESRGRLPFRRTSFAPIVSFMRRDLGIPSPTACGQPRGGRRRRKLSIPSQPTTRPQTAA